jgi:hypothetical protein
VKKLTTAKVVIKRQLTPDGSDEVWVGDDEALSLVEVLGLLEFAKDTIIRGRMTKAEEGESET